MILRNDRQITISSAGSRKATQWPAQTLRLSELWERLRTPVRSAETVAEYMAMKRGQQDDLKDVGGYVGGTLKGNRRKADAVVGRDVITLDLDLDHVPAGGTDDILRRVSSLGCGFCVYSTRKHAPGAPRLRVLLPLDRTVTADEYEAIARKAACLIDPSMAPFDPSTFEPSRLMYWPSCCVDGQYVYLYGDLPFLSAGGMLALYDDWHDVALWPQVPGAQQAHAKLAARQEDPTTKGGIIGAFCRVYDVYSVMDKFIPDAYTPVDNSPDRYTYTGGSTAGGAVVYDNGKFLFSHHATDPAGGKLCNSFDLVRLHLYGDKDDDAKPDTPVNKLPSFVEMSRLSLSDNDVAALLDREQYATATSDFDAPAQEEGEAPENWMRRLKRNSNNAIDKSIDNMWIILENDPLLKGKIARNDFAHLNTALAPLPWENKKPCPRIWEDSDDNGVNWYLEKVYGITGEKKVDSALNLCRQNHSFDPVTDYLKALKWDGVPRLDTFFLDYLGAANTEYVRAATRKAFVAAVARAMDPGCKYDVMVILTGAQGIGKSTLLRKMGKGWFTDGVKTFEGKELCEIIQGMWIVEIGELEALNHAEVGRIKQVLSQTVDRFRAAYGRNVQECPRRCVFFGTSNNREYLRDRTGNRRFLPIDLGITVPTKSVFRDLDNEVSELWAEAMFYWQMGEPLHLSGAIEEAAKAEQEQHRECGPREGLIREFVERKIPVGWHKLSLAQRQMFWSDSVHNTLELMERDRVCALEIWCEALGGDAKNIRYSDTAEINSVLDASPGWERLKTGREYGYCGNQRGFRRIQD